jgi:hypothetical protein
MSARTTQELPIPRLIEASSLMEAPYAFRVALAHWRAHPDHSLAGFLHPSSLILEGSAAVQ